MASNSEQQEHPVEGQFTEKDVAVNNIDNNVNKEEQETNTDNEKERNSEIQERMENKTTGIFEQEKLVGNEKVEDNKKKDLSEEQDKNENETKGIFEQEKSVADEKVEDNTDQEQDKNGNEEKRKSEEKKILEDKTLEDNEKEQNKMDSKILLITDEKTKEDTEDKELKNAVNDNNSNKCSSSVTPINNNIEVVDNPPAYEDPIITSENFWLEGNFKKITKRVEDGGKFVEDISKMLHERAEIENLYALKIKDWSRKWSTYFCKSTEYGILTSSLQSSFKESEALCNLHLSVYDKLEELSKSILNWKNDMYRKSITKYREYKRSEDAFTKAQKPWSVKYNEVKLCMAAYHSANSLRNINIKQVEDAKVRPNTTPDQLNKIANKVTKSNQDIDRTKEKYEDSLRDISNYNPKYIEDMKYEFNKSQKFEEERRDFIKSNLLLFQTYIDRTLLAKNYKQIYEAMLNSYNKIDTKADLMYFQEVYGTNHQFPYLKYEEYDASIHVNYKVTGTTTESSENHVKNSKKRSGVCTTL